MDYRKSNLKEVTAYILAGIATGFLHIATYQCLLWNHVGYIFSNVVAHILSKLGAYILNKKVVFRTSDIPLKDTVKEFCKFFVARGTTGLIDFVGLIFLVEMMNCDPEPAKYFLVVLGIVLNYFFSKCFVFKRK